MWGLRAVVGGGWWEALEVERTRDIGPGPRT